MNIKGKEKKSGAIPIRFYESDIAALRYIKDKDGLFISDIVRRIIHDSPEVKDARDFLNKYK